MGFTHFPHGVSSFGVPVIGGSGTLPVMGGNSAKVFFVDPANGDNGNDGVSPERAFDTIAYAYSKTVSGRGDTIYLLGDGGTTGTARDAAITWANSNTHLVGLCAPGINRRARISPPTTDTDVDAYTPYITLSGSGCVLANFSIFQGNSEDGKASVGIKLSGSRNYIGQVDIITGAHANQGDEASYNLQITGSENVIEYCYIGQDTAARGNNAASANIRFGSGAADEATRNVIRHCILPMFADDTEPVFVLAATAADTQRWNLMEHCVCVNTGTSTIDAAISWSDTTGILLVKDSAFHGMTDITAADNAYVKLYGISAGLGVVDVGHFKSVDIA